MNSSSMKNCVKYITVHGENERKEERAALSAGMRHIFLFLELHARIKFNDTDFGAIRKSCRTKSFHMMMKSSRMNL